MKLSLKWLVLGAAFGLIGLSSSGQEQGSSGGALWTLDGAGIATDWTHRHVIFSSPNDSQAESNIEREPRSWLQQWRRRGFPEVSSHDVRDEARDHGWDPWDGERRHRRRGPRHEKEALERDWNEAVNTGFNSYGGDKYPAKYSFSSANPMPSCTSDYVVFALGNSVSSSFNIIGFSNIYLNSGGGSSFCSGSSPTLLFAYYASTGSTAGGLNTSPALSLDGTQVAFIEGAGSGAILHVLKWQAASSTPTFPNTTATLHDCAILSSPPCEYSFGYAGTHTATRSSPFVDYATDTAYASDNAGNVYAVSPVFSGGSPSTKGGWPAGGVNVGLITPLTAPVYDSVSQRVFVAGATNGVLYYLNTVGTCGAISAPCLGGSISVSSGTITEPPVVDSTTQKVFVFSNAAPSGSGVSGASVVQTDTSLSMASRVVAGMGGGSANAIRSGDFNEAYLNSGAGASGAALYGCGDSSNGTVDAPVLYAFPFTSSPTAGTLNATALAGSGLFLSSGPSSAGSCSSITENLNQTTSNDRLFVGVSSNCATGEAGGCILSYDVTGGFPSGSPATAPVAHAAEPGGTSGIIVDNVADQSIGTKLTTDVYFLSAQTGGVGQACNKYSGGTVSGNCAVSLTQGALR